ncbi:cupin domain-containing protein [Agarivorans sp. 1_MG-2023]|uniref:cupin domain-containing protein n=1 Tax=Agarivorans sp. 1_MG-2023 TaxID=3062634 RepID=UPI0026E19317|nr:cupin domain-containing protein [Agarivorans sp. 1_MG-2023]MDO6764174.1 cupin domain-containing protein [Agarivorans sp. 1_MG-2023]
MSKATVIALNQQFEHLQFVGNRTPDSSEAELAGAFRELCLYRNGAIYIGHYAGSSEWERHSQGDEIVQVIEGATNLILLTKDGETSLSLNAGELMVVPQNTWHRFETPKGVKVMTVTPQPTDHQVDTPSF